MSDSQDNGTPELSLNIVNEWSHFEILSWSNTKELLLLKLNTGKENM